MEIKIKKSIKELNQEYSYMELCNDIIVKFEYLQDGEYVSDDLKHKVIKRKLLTSEVRVNNRTGDVEISNSLDNDNYSGLMFALVWSFCFLDCDKNYIDADNKAIGILLQLEDFNKIKAISYFKEKLINKHAGNYEGRLSNIMMYLTGGGDDDGIYKQNYVSGDSVKPLSSFNTRATNIENNGVCTSQEIEYARTVLSSFFIDIHEMSKSEITSHYESFDKDLCETIIKMNEEPKKINVPYKTKKISSEDIGKIYKIIGESVNVLYSDIKTSDRISEDYGLDSLSFVNVIIDLENEFKISLPDDKLDEIKTIKDIISVVEKNFTQ